MTETLIPPVLTKEMRIKGGSKTGHEAPGKSMSKRIYCDFKCVLWEKCPFSHLSKKDPVEGKKYKYYCFVNKSTQSAETSEDIKTRIQRFISSGREGVIQEMVDVLTEISLDVTKEGTLDARKGYFNALAKFMDVVHGRIVKNEIKGDMSIKSEDLAKIYEEIYGKKEVSSGNIPQKNDKISGDKSDTSTNI